MKLIESPGSDVEELLGVEVDSDVAPEDGVHRDAVDRVLGRTELDELAILVLDADPGDSRCRGRESVLIAGTRHSRAYLSREPVEPCTH